MRGALEVRARAAVPKHVPICVYDLAERLGVEVRFCAGNTLGGMYVRSSNVILVPSDRPPGRQAFSCAHELGHWFFRHGSRIDQIAHVDCVNDEDPRERLANLFAGYLLMPSWTVRDVFERRKWEARSCGPLEIFIASSQLGVGYQTLIEHLRWSLGAISADQAKQLLQTTPKKLRQSVIDTHEVRRLVIADLAWANVPIDLQVGDMAILPGGSKLEGRSVEVSGSHNLGVVVTARRPGVSRATSDDEMWAVFLRVSRQDFVGRNLFRHLEDPDVDETA